MHLIWVDEKRGTLVGFKGVVLPSFARKDLPEFLRGYFAFPREVEGRHVHFFPPQPAVHPPYDLSWKDESENFYGVRGVVASNVDIGCLPEQLAAAVVTSNVADARRTTFLSDIKPLNPTYMRSSDAIGIAADREALRLLELKQKASQNVPGFVHAGRSGKFTATFAGGMPLASGFNL